MRKLSKSEARLLGIFATAIFLAANLLAIRSWMSARRVLLQETSALEMKISEDRDAIESAETLKEAADWIAGHRPPALSDDNASAALLDTVRKAAESQQLGIAAETLLPPTGTGEMAGANLQIKLTGAFPSIVRLLFDLQKPEAWRSIDKLTIRSEATPPNALLEFQIRQYYTAPASVSANP